MLSFQLWPDLIRFAACAAYSLRSKASCFLEVMGVSLHVVAIGNGAVYH